MTSTRYDEKQVVIIGGGIFGVSTGYHLAKQGADVILIDQGPLGGEASGRSIAWINSANYRSAEYHTLRMLGMDRWRTFLTLRPEASQFLKFGGGLTWSTVDELDVLRETYAHERSIGYHAEWLLPEEVSSAIKGVATTTIPEEGALFHPGEAWVDLPSVIRLLRREFASLGGVTYENAGPAKVEIRDNALVGVRMANGQMLEADAVLLATGGSVPSDLSELGVQIEDESPISLLVFTEPVDTQLSVVLNTPKVAVRPTVDRGLALDADWAEREIVRHDDGSFDYLDSTVDGLLEAAREVLEGHPQLRMAAVGTGKKPIPGGGEPVFGELQSVEGLFVAFSHSGATLGLIAPEILAREILDEKKSPLLDTFRPDRFRIPGDK